MPSRKRWDCRRIVYILLAFHCYVSQKHFSRLGMVFDDVNRMIPRV